MARSRLKVTCVGQCPARSTNADVPFGHTSPGVREHSPGVPPFRMIWHHRLVSDSRDVQAFDDRSTHYEQGWLGQLHREIVQRTVTMVVEANDSPQRVSTSGADRSLLAYAPSIFQRRLS